jgi:hypothetical protein
LPSRTRGVCPLVTRVSQGPLHRPKPSNRPRNERLSFRGLPKETLETRCPSGPDSSSRVSTPLRSAFAVSHDLDGLPLSSSVWHVSSSHARGVLFPFGIPTRRARERCGPKAATSAVSWTTKRTHAGEGHRSDPTSTHFLASQECAFGFVDRASLPRLSGPVPNVFTPDQVKRLTFDATSVPSRRVGTGRLLQTEVWIHSLIPPYPAVAPVRSHAEAWPPSSSAGVSALDQLRCVTEG